ncbi:Protein TIC 22-like, chloroplastic, partial [Mucuna pruriens]
MNFDGFHKALADLQTRCSTLLGNLTRLQPGRAPLPFLHASPAWARIAQTVRSRPMTVETIEERLEGIPVYALSNASEEFLLVSGSSTGKNLGLFCFNKDDAEALLNQVTLIDPHARQGSKVVPVALNKVFQLKVNGVAFRLIPEFSQVKNALKEREKSGIASSGFSGVPVFQSRSLILKSQNKRYRPLFFRKEDLENTLQSAAHEQNRVNPTIRQGDIQVATLEDVIKEMKESSTSNWDDVIFIPPGFDVSDDSNEHLKYRVPHGDTSLVREIAIDWNLGR